MFLCERCKQHLQSCRQVRARPTPLDIIQAHFNKYSGIGDARSWLLETMNRFKSQRLRRDDQFEAISLLLKGEAYLWYTANIEIILNFEIFNKLFLEQCVASTASTTISIRGTGASATDVFSWFTG
ncbi:unnamed protein product [Adineta ricciae]|uniref:Uncharacterized protein n=1 Tax=Adineta ricciae TaxID=249248 RepID=A0A816HJ73_ADIRI|nr:unnamed protein product [Adineta ricciae]